MRVVAYCTSTGFNINKLAAYLKSTYRATRIREVLHTHIPFKQQTADKVESEEKGGDVFFFPFGALVCWGLSEDQEQQILEEIRPFEQQRIDLLEEDVFYYIYGEQAKIEDDEIVLPNHDSLTKLAFSHGLAQSVKLSVFEQTIQKTIHLTKELPELLATQGSIKLSRQDIRRMMGRLFIDRSSINLHQELLDTPEFFWEHSDLESYYALVAHYLDRERRVNVLNQRLRIVQELFDMLAAELNHQHSSRLEWTIIWLIVIEVLLHVVTDILKVRIL
ncbi:MAG TPA: RMD1 family protein [Gammaproteobacteria bacterium]|nr:RMD1 family protein [Gammaproteobacteria bacterium]HQZ87382.1 RMD1 family protein [Gammaproteobacteria bacterium]HRA42810.1 RMD1 family protein [Gammaproteobacteria bacterium]